MKDGKKEAVKKIEEYFSKNDLDSSKTKKIKTLAMAHRIRLGEYRKRFCKKCYSDLKSGIVRIKNGKKNVVCKVCKCVNRWKLN